MAILSRKIVVSCFLENRPGILMEKKSAGTYFEGVSGGGVTIAIVGGGGFIREQLRTFAERKF